MSVHPGSIWIDRNWGRLPPGFWVAATATGVVAENRDYDTLIAAVRTRGVPLSDVTVVFVPSGVVQ